MIISFIRLFERVGGACAFNCSSWSDLPQRQRSESPRSGFVSVDGLWLERHHSAGRRASS